MRKRAKGEKISQLGLGSGDDSQGRNIISGVNGVDYTWIGLCIQMCTVAVSGTTQCRRGRGARMGKIASVASVSAHSTRLSPEEALSRVLATFQTTQKKWKEMTTTVQIAQDCQGRALMK